MPPAIADFLEPFQQPNSFAFLDLVHLQMPRYQRLQRWGRTRGVIQARRHPNLLWTVLAEELMTLNDIAVVTGSVLMALHSFVTCLV